MVVVGLSLLSIYTLAPVDLVAVGLLGFLVWRSRARWKWLLVAAAAGGVTGVLLTWWLGDVANALDFSLTSVDQIWVGAVFAAIGVAVVASIRSRWTQRISAIVAVAAFLLAGGLAINRDAGVFPTVADVEGVSSVPALVLPKLPREDQNQGFNANLYRTWVAPSSMPRVGRYGSVNLPGSASAFPARPAIVYLPPAALVANPPALPVLIVLSGQGPSASPINVINSGHLVDVMNRIANAHHGLAPIVVIPDQLTLSVHNPLCVNGPLGNSDEYLTTDVPRWIHQHLDVQGGPRAWMIAGFSQGGTCAIQLAAGHPNLFGSFIDVSGQIGPQLDSVQETIARGFQGNKAAYEAAQPLHIMATHRPYLDTAAFFAVGAGDPRYGPVLPILAAASARAGMHVSTFLVPGTGHNWSTARVGLDHGINWLLPRVGLAP